MFGADASLQTLLKISTVLALIALHIQLDAPKGASSMFNFFEHSAGRPEGRQLHVLALIALHIQLEPSPPPARSRVKVVSLFAISRIGGRMRPELRTA